MLFFPISFSLPTSSWFCFVPRKPPGIRCPLRSWSCVSSVRTCILPQCSPHYILLPVPLPASSERSPSPCPLSVTALMAPSTSMLLKTLQNSSWTSLSFCPKSLFSLHMLSAGNWKVNLGCLIYTKSEWWMKMTQSISRGTWLA